MASLLKVDKLDPQSGTALELGTSGDTVSLPSGATLDISASTLTPPATMPASSGINFTSLNATNLGSGTVPTARLGTGTASSSTVLYGDQTYKAEPGGGFNEVDSWVLTTSLTGDADPISSNLARRSVTGWAAATTGTGMTESSGIFTFPSTGQWLVSWQLQFYLAADSRYDNYIIEVTTNDSSYSAIGQAAGSVTQNNSGNTYCGVFGQTLVDVTDVANVKVRFKVAHMVGTAITVGNQDGASQFNFYRLADT